MPASAFTKNRAAFPPQELAEHIGKWVAFSPDGTKIIAAHEDLETLTGIVRKAGYDPHTAVFEGMPEEDTIYGGGLH